MIFLTAPGAGVFGNDVAWVLDALQYVMDKYRDYPIDLKFNIYGQDPTALPVLKRYPKVVRWNPKHYEKLLDLGGQRHLGPEKMTE